MNYSTQNPEITVVQISSGSHFFGVSFLHVFCLFESIDTSKKHPWLDEIQKLRNRKNPLPKTNIAETFGVEDSRVSFWGPGLLAGATWVFWEFFFGEMFPT